MGDKVCPQCGERFTPSGGGQRFCTSKCRERSRAKYGRDFYLVDEQVQKLLDALKEDYGSWANVSHATGVPERTIYAMRRHERKRVEARILDRLTLDSSMQLWEFHPEP